MTDQPETTPAQARMLRFLVEHPQWHTFVELDQIRLLEADDVVSVPSLIERGWVEHRMLARCVRITPSGQVIAEAINHG